MIKWFTLTEELWWCTDIKVTYQSVRSRPLIGKQKENSHKTTEEIHMLYPVIIHKDEGSSYGVIVPDFPGVFSGGETMDEAIANISSAIETYYEGKAQVILPMPSKLETVVNSEYAQGGAVVFVDLNFDFLEKNLFR